MSITEKVSYLKGLAEGLDINASTKEGKVLLAIIDALNDIALTVDDIDNDLDNIADEVSDIEESVYDLEDEVFGECDDDDDCDCDEDMYEVKCPACGNEITVDFDVIQSGAIKCPNCGNPLEFDLSALEKDDCDCGCGHDR